MRNSCFVTRLRLFNFRNYEYAEIIPGSGICVFTGTNGSGKTNLLEAVSFLSPGKGIRGAALAEVNREGSRDLPWSVAAETADAKIGTGYGGSERRAVKIDGKHEKGPSSLARRFSVIWLSPQMDGIFTGPASGRRKFLDRMAYALDPEHAARVASYEKAMGERLRILKDGGNDNLWLSALEKRMAEEGVAIAAARRETVSLLSGAMEGRATLFPVPELEAQGEYESMLAGLPALAVEEAFRGKLRDSRSLDAARGRTGTGTHRSDIRVLYREKNAPAAICSTGEQKALLMSMILGLCRALKAVKGRLPAVLLDEVAAHLDEGRRNELFSEILALGCQAWLTGTEKALFAGLERKASYFNVKNSTVLEA